MITNYKGWIIEYSEELKVNSRGMFCFNVYSKDSESVIEVAKTLSEAKEIVDLELEN